MAITDGVTPLNGANLPHKSGADTVSGQWGFSKPVATPGGYNFADRADFENWSAGAAAAPDGWSVVGAGATIARDTTNFKIGTAAAALTRVGTDCYLAQSILAKYGPVGIWQSQTVILGKWVRGTVASRARIGVYDGSTVTFSPYHTGGSAFEFLSVTLTLGAGITALEIRGYVDTGNTTAQFDGAVFALGSALSGVAWPSGSSALTATPPAGGYIFGLGLANGADAVNDIDIYVGEAASDDTTFANRVLMALASVLTKQLDAAWAVGSGAGGRDIGTIADGTYHLYEIMRPDTGVVDALFSRNPGPRNNPLFSSGVTITIATPAVVTWTDHGLQVGSSVIFATTGALPTGLVAGTRYWIISAGLTRDTFQVSATEGGAAINTTGTQSGVHTATADPVLPANYTKKRRIGSLLRQAGSLVAFLQDGDYFRRKATGANDWSVTNPGTAAVLRALVNIPLGFNFFALINIVIGQTTTAINPFAIITDPGANDEAPAGNTAPLYNTPNVTNSSALSTQGELMTVRTNKAGELRTRNAASDGNTVFYGNAFGWIDTRGKNG